MTAPKIKIPPEVFHARHGEAIAEVFFAAESVGLAVSFVIDAAMIDAASDDGSLTTALLVAATAIMDGDRAGFFKNDDGADLGRWMVGPDKDAIVAALAANPSGRPESLS